MYTLRNNVANNLSSFRKNHLYPKTSTSFYSNMGKKNSTRNKPLNIKQMNAVKTWHYGKETILFKHANAGNIMTFFSVICLFYEMTHAN